MIWFVIGHIFSTIISLMRISRLSENDKDIVILILRHQLDVMVRKQNHPVRPNRAEKTLLAVLSVQLKQATKRTIGQLGEVIRIVRPETIIRWHKELVRHNGSLQKPAPGLRFLHGRNDFFAHHLRVGIHRIGNASCSFRRYHQQPE